MLVYRFENDFKKGPWSALCNTIWSRSWESRVTHPSIHHDLHNNGLSLSKMMDRRASPEDYHCGFVSIEQIHSWFNRKVQRGLIREGFGLSVYSVRKPQVIVGQRQCVFLISNARLVRRVTKYDEFQKFIIDSASIKH